MKSLTSLIIFMAAMTSPTALVAQTGSGEQEKIVLLRTVDQELPESTPHPLPEPNALAALAFASVVILARHRLRP